MSYSVAMLSVHTSPLDNPGRTKDAGGMNVYMLALAYALAQHNLTIDIFTRWTNERIPQIVQLHPAVRVIHIKAGPLASVHKHDLYEHLPTFVHHIEEFRRREAGAYDVIHSHYWLSGVAAMQLAQRWDVPHVTMFHTLAYLKMLANPHQAEPALRLEMERQLIEHTDRIIASTADERTQILHYSGVPAKRVAVIPCGVDTDLFVPHERPLARERLGLHPQRPILLFAGRLDAFKGPDLFLRAAAMMQKDAQIVIVGGKLGDDPTIQELQHLAHQLAIADRVYFLGARPLQEMPWVYSAAHVTVVPSYHETFGLTAVESLACATPVVATRAGGLTTVVQHGKTGFLVPRSASFFAKHLDMLLQNDLLYARLSKAARPSVLSYCWQRIAHQVYGVYDELISDMSCLVV